MAGGYPTIQIRETGNTITRGSRGTSTAERKTIRVEHNNVQHYATPLLRKRGTTPYHATKDAVMPSL